MTRVLILTPWVPVPVTGACQQDRFSGVKQMKALGYDVHTIAGFHTFQDPSAAKKAYAELGVPLTLVPHPESAFGLIGRNLGKILLNPALLDGAALEYVDDVYRTAVMNVIHTFKPDVLWIEYSTFWPMLSYLKPLKIPMIVKSSLNEPGNCIDEHGGSMLSYIKAMPKVFGERTVAHKADLVLAITPEEEDWYNRLGAKHTGTLPLRGLSQCFRKKEHGKKDVLDVVFLSSNYNMGHNRDAFLFLAKQILPLVRKELPGKVVFHATGSKFPESYKKFLAEDFRYEGFVPDLGAFLATMDAALCPWISGRGMQQKVFEPLCRSLPLLTTKTAGYPFENGKEVLLCATSEEYVQGLRKLLDPQTRNAIATAAYNKAEVLFSEDRVKHIVKVAIESCLKTTETTSKGRRAPQVGV